MEKSKTPQHSVKPNLNVERKKVSEEPLRDQDDVTEKCSGKIGLLLRKESIPIYDFETPYEESMNNECPIPKRSQVLRI